MSNQVNLYSSEATHSDCQDKMKREVRLRFVFSFDAQIHAHKIKAMLSVQSYGYDTRCKIALGFRGLACLINLMYEKLMIYLALYPRQSLISQKHQHLL